MGDLDPESDLTNHRLQPLLAPRSVAVVGASARSASFGNIAVTELLDGGFKGPIYPVNPRYTTVSGLACSNALVELEQVPDLVQFCIANDRLEAEFDRAITLGIPASVIYGSCYLPSDKPGDTLLDRLTKKARAAGMRVCGGNCMGYRNLHGGVMAGIYRTSDSALSRGPVALISHSGTAFSVLSSLDERVGFELSISAGQELATTAADYLDYAVDMPGIRCVAMFLEVIRDPAGFIRAVQRAHDKNQTVIVLKVGKSAASARFAMSHSGALVGDDAAYEAFFERHGIIRVDSLDDMVNAIQLIAYGKPLAAGDLTAALDSGGKRELLVDTSEEVDVPLATLGARTVATLAANLDDDLDPVNPLDHWGTGGEGWFERLVNCVVALAEENNSALCAITGTVSWYDKLLLEVAQHTDKPLALLTDFLRRNDFPRAKALNDAGFPVLAGERSGLLAIKAVMKHRDYFGREPIDAPPDIDRQRQHRWQERLNTKDPLDEATSLSLLNDYGIPSLPFAVIENEPALWEAAHTIGFPIVLKTAMPGISHKSDQGGVILNLAQPQALAEAYRDLSVRLGPRVLVTRQAPTHGIEMALGLVHDPLVGLLMMIGLGGTLIELLDDKTCVPAPSDAREIARALQRLTSRPLLDGLRGQPPVDVGALVNSAVALSTLSHELANEIGEIDVNPLLVSSQGCLALDALVVPSRQM